MTLSNRDVAVALLIALIALVLSASILLLVHFSLSASRHSDLIDSTSHQKGDFSREGASFQIMVGSGMVRDHSMVIEEMHQDQAILAKVEKFRAKDYPFLRLDMGDIHPEVDVLLVWRTHEARSTLHSYPLKNAGSGQRYFSLADADNWKGEILEIAFSFYGELREAPLVLDGVKLMRNEPALNLMYLWDRWTSFIPWHHGSINSYPGVGSDVNIYPAPVFFAWAFLSWVLIRVFRHVPLIRQFGTLSVSRIPVAEVVVFLVAWVSLDLIWQHRINAQIEETRAKFSGKSVDERKRVDWDGEYYDFAQSLKGHFEEAGQRIALLYTDSTAKPLSERLRYHLLPEHYAVILKGFDKRSLRAIVEDVSWIALVTSERGNLSAITSELMSALANEDKKLEPVISTPIATLYQVLAR